MSKVHVYGFNFVFLSIHRALDKSGYLIIEG